MKKLGELLVEQGKLSERDVERTLLAQAEMGGLFGQVLVKLGLVSEQDVALALCGLLEVPLQLAADYPEDPIQLEAVAQDFLVNNGVVPVAVTDTAVKFVAAVPQDPFLARALTMALDRPVSIALGLESDINRALQRYLQRDDAQDEELSDQFAGQSDDEFIEHLRDLASEAPVIQLPARGLRAIRPFAAASASTICQP